MWKHAFLLRELVKRDFKSRYAGSLFGFLWSFVMPLWQLVLFAFVFATVMKISLVGERTENFAIFLFCGLLPWMAFNEGVQRASTAVTDNASLVKKLTFPGHLLILTVVLTALLHEAVAVLVFTAYLAKAGQLSYATLPLLLVAVPLQVGFTLGLGLLLCTAHVFFRDTVQVVGMILLGWFYLTPIVYPLSLVPERYQGWAALNPLSVLVALYRQAFLGDQLALPAGTGTLALTTILVLLAGGWLFAHFKPAFVDEL